MSTQSPNLPLPIQPVADPLDTEYAPLMSERFSKLWAPAAENLAGAGAVRHRLLDRISASKAKESAMHTAQRHRLQREALGPGIAAQTLYACQDERALRPGEPLRARLIELKAGTTLTPAFLGSEELLRQRRREWLVIKGAIELDGQRLSMRDYHTSPLGHPTPTLIGRGDALIFLRESTTTSENEERPRTVFDAEAGWPDFAPGIQRRVLWHDGEQAAMLYYAQAGAAVPQHRHDHDEECLMLQGQFFLDELLLQPGDYQLAPAGTGHRISETDTGVVIYAHGDLNLHFVG